MLISKNVGKMILADFVIFGYTKDENWVKFEAGEDYEAFLVTKKENFK